MSRKPQNAFNDERRPYWEKLRDPRWQKRRLEVMEKADFTCSICGDKSRNQQVHHRYYEKGKEPWEYDDNALTCLCEDCHTRVESRQNSIRKCLASAFTVTQEMDLVCKFSSMARDSGAEEIELALGCLDCNPEMVTALARIHREYCDLSYKNYKLEEENEELKKRLEETGTTKNG